MTLDPFLHGTVRELRRIDGVKRRLHVVRHQRRDALGWHPAADGIRAVVNFRFTEVTTTQLVHVTRSRRRFAT